jgi:hypothetical protein
MAMERARPGRALLLRGLFSSAFLLTIIPAAIASAVAVYVLYAIQPTRGADPGDRASAVALPSDDLSTEERRELTRQMLKERRENPQVPAEVTPAPRPALASAVETGGGGNSGGTGTATDAKPRAERASGAAGTASAAPPLPTARPVPPRPRSEPAAPTAVAAIAPPASGPVSLAAASPPAAPTGPPAPMPAQSVPAGASTLPSVVVNAPVTASPAGIAQPDPPRSFAANVFSTISVFAGTAANATGNTVNWVIALPGKAIAAGGKLLGGEDTSGNQPSSAGAPPAKRNDL